MSRNETRHEITRNMALAFFACAWADWADEYGPGTQGNGVDVMDEMPEELEPSAVYAAFDLCARMERQHGMHMADLFAKAVEVSGDDGDRAKTPEMFGHYAAMGAMGHGVNLYDALGSKAAKFVNTPWREYGHFEWTDPRFPIP